MKVLRWLLLPFAVLYGAVSSIRNFLYSKKLKASYRIPVRSIVVGNLSTGGTGKTPLIGYLVDFFLNEKLETATLSRGYGRSTKGVLTANETSTARDIGDEPLQYHQQFGNKIQVTVAERRKDGVQHILEHNPNTELILLDDAFQHRAVTAGLYILVTEFKRPYSNDFLLPVGRLREPKSGARRADIIVVSKCPNSITDADRNRLRKELATSNQPVFFSSLRYKPFVHISGPEIDTPKHILLVTGIGNPEPLRRYLETMAEVTHLTFPDHHSFTEKDIASIHQKFNTFASRDAIIVTTEKDYMRLQQFSAVSTSSSPWYYQPITIQFEEEETFKKLLRDYVDEV